MRKWDKGAWASFGMVAVIWLVVLAIIGGIIWFVKKLSQ